ncbi:MAG: hypothetical protein ABUT20_54385, partial [Bacteroidota bacterium]
MKTLQTRISRLITHAIILLSFGLALHAESILFSDTHPNRVPIIRQSNNNHTPSPRAVVRELEAQSQRLIAAFNAQRMKNGECWQDGQANHGIDHNPAIRFYDVVEKPINPIVEGPNSNILINHQPGPEPDNGDPDDNENDPYYTLSALEYNDLFNYFKFNKELFNPLSESVFQKKLLRSSYEIMTSTRLKDDDKAAIKNFTEAAA